MTPRQCVDTLCFGFALLLANWHAHAAPQIERVLDTPCRALALDQEPYVAALGDEAVTVWDKRGQHAEPLPEALRGSSVSVGVFFGRDYRIRLAGTAHTPQGDQVRYYRSLAQGLRPAPDELGPLGKPGAPGLVALLGTADPEIVCRPGQACLIKRVSGWGKASSPAGLTRVGLSLGNGWAIAGSSLLTLQKDWQALPAGPWQLADDAFVRGEHACVVERAASRLYHYDGRSWHGAASPVTGPRSLWGNETELWVAGDGGVSVLEDGSFRAVPGLKAVAQVLGRNANDVWLCGGEGVFRVRATSD